jgi:hypothetical protein
MPTNRKTLTDNDHLLILRNVGIDATIEDCKLFIALTFPGHTPPTGEELAQSADEFKFTGKPGLSPRKHIIDRTIRHLLRNENARRMMANAIVADDEGRIAIREAMTRLSAGALRQLLGLPASETSTAE